MLIRPLFNSALRILHSAFRTRMNLSRRQARIAALQTLYELDATSHPVTDVLARNLEEPFSENVEVESGIGERLDREAQAFAGELVAGVLQHRDELDRIIERSAPNWPIEQMSRVDKTILRLAIFEVLFHNRVPLKAAINEAVELGKRDRKSTRLNSSH